MTMSSSPLMTGRASSGIFSGGCDPSASMTMTTFAFAARAPASTAPARPSFGFSRASRVTGRVWLRRRTIGWVSSPEASSTTMISIGTEAPPARIRVMIPSIFSASFRVGTITERLGLSMGMGAENRFKSLSASRKGNCPAGQIGYGRRSELRDQSANRRRRQLNGQHGSLAHGDRDSGRLAPAGLVLEEDPALELDEDLPEGL